MTDTSRLCMLIIVANRVHECMNFVLYKISHNNSLSVIYWCEILRRSRHINYQSVSNRILSTFAGCNVGGCIE